MTAPAVSVVLPVYNGARHLAAALASVGRQSVPPAELVAIDDGSTDDSAAIVAGFAASFPVRLFHQANAGQSAARNRGVREAAGELIAFLDQDDAWDEEHLALLAPRLAADPRLGWVYSDFDEMDDAGRVVTRGFLAHHDVRHPKRSVEDCVSHDLMVIPSASLLRRAALTAVGGFDESLSGYEDDDLFVRLFLAGWRHAYVEEPTVRFRVHDRSSSTSQRFLDSRLRYAAKLAAALPDDPRMRRYYVRDAIAPRFFETCLDDYVRACSARDWEAAARVRPALARFAAARRRSWRLRWKMLGARSPRVFRLLMRLNDALPGGLRFNRHPGVTLR